VRRLLHDPSGQIVERFIREGRLLALPGRNLEARFPVVQFGGDGSVVDGLRETKDALMTKQGFAVLNFLINPDKRLGGRSPIDLLREGEIELVVEAARRVGEQGA
jgi:hypothetical protein